MPRVNRVDIDEKGNIAVEFSCYGGDGCEKAEEALREGLEALGISVKSREKRRKSPAEIASETGLSGKGRTRPEVTS